MPGLAATLSGDLLAWSSNAVVLLASTGDPVSAYAEAPPVDNLAGRYSARTLVDVQGLWLSNPLFETTEGNVETIAPRIVGEAQ
jgi:hypothetical protein